MTEQRSGPGLLRGPAHTARRAGPHQPVHFLAVSFCQIANNGARFRTGLSCVGDASTDALNFLQIRVLVGAASMSRVLTAGDDICADASHA
jgi:hypothetical protein